MIEPNKPVYETEIENALKGLQRAVGGRIEGTYPFDDISPMKIGFGKAVQNLQICII